MMPAAYPCPCCGFVVFDEAPGSYAICSVCDWEDDAVQLTNPCSGGGANSDSLADAQARILEKVPPEIQVFDGHRRDSDWRPLREPELDGFRFEVEMGGAWPFSAGHSDYWRTPENTVYTVTDYYGGPRGGVALHEGRPHHYESEFSDQDDGYTDTFMLRPIDAETLALAKEDWRIWLRWSAAHAAGQASPDTHAALPAERKRHEELDGLLRERLPPSGDGLRMRGKFVPTRQRPSRPRAGVLRVRWSVPPSS